MKIYFSNNLKKLRREKGISQKELGIKFNIGITAVSAWELGRNVPDVVTLIKLADFFNVELRAFLTEEL